MKIRTIIPNFQYNIFRLSATLSPILFKTKSGNHRFHRFSQRGRGRNQRTDSPPRRQGAKKNKQGWAFREGAEGLAWEGAVATFWDRHPPKLLAPRASPPSAAPRLLGMGRAPLAPWRFSFQRLPCTQQATSSRENKKLEVSSAKGTEGLALSSHGPAEGGFRDQRFFYVPSVPLCVLCVPAFPAAKAPKSIRHSPLHPPPRFGTLGTS